MVHVVRKQWEPLLRSAPITVINRGIMLARGVCNRVRTGTDILKSGLIRDFKNIAAAGQLYYIIDYA